MKATAKRVLLEVLGWTLLVVGILALVLPGPGLLLTALGLAVLSQQYDWAERRLEPVRLRGLKAAAYGVQTWPRIALSVLGAALLTAAGVLWIAGPDQPSWWLPWDWTWLPGGIATGITLIFSAVLALVLIGYSYRRFRGRPEALAELEEDIEEADEEAHWGDHDGADEEDHDGAGR